MTRKDTILIAVVINAGLLAVLFTTAVIYDTERGSEQMDFVIPLADNTPPIDVGGNLIATVSTSDEVDNVLKYYHTPASQPIVVQTEPEIYLPPSTGSQTRIATIDEGALSRGKKAQYNPPQEEFIEVTVKKGDVLEKIARAHQSSVGAIKRANQIEGERLSIGQVLKVPVNSNAISSSVASIPIYGEGGNGEVKLEVKKTTKAIEPINQVNNESEEVYYVIKSGDNPWKISKQYGVKYDEILRLNRLDEDKARNLKIGDRIRLK
ncbi:MAG: LysM peptidoglycan-binding domain-containing protein [Parachlamydiaceae bacterium]